MLKKLRLNGVSLSLLLLSGLVGLCAGLGSYTFFYAQGASYLSNDPRACVNCHIMRDHFDGWQKASHHAVATCNDCHTPHNFVGKYLAKMENGFWHSKGFTLQDFHEPIQIKPKNLDILNHNCVDCHREMVSEVIPVRSPNAHPHNDYGDDLNCVRCHRGVGHGPTE